MHRIRALPRAVQVGRVVGAALLACGCGAVVLALALPSAGATPTPVAVSTVLWAIVHKGSVEVQVGLQERGIGDHEKDRYQGRDA
jgi:hypothetical protein